MGDHMSNSPSPVPRSDVRLKGLALVNSLPSPPNDILEMAARMEDAAEKIAQGHNPRIGDDTPLSLVLSWPHQLDVAFRVAPLLTSRALIFWGLEVGGAAEYARVIQPDSAAKRSKLLRYGVFIYKDICVDCPGVIYLWLMQWPEVNHLSLVYGPGTAAISLWLYSY